MRVTVAELREGGPCLSVGINSADPMHLGAELDQVAGAGVQMLHIDVMDGVFCPQMTGGPAVVAALSESFVRDVHLMIVDPLTKVDNYVKAGADIISFHVEAERQPLRLLQSLEGTGILRGVALTPGTPLTVIDPLIEDLELILVLAVNPGWSGQRQASLTPARTAELLARVRGREILIGLDGGVTHANAAGMASMGADLFVAGSAIFDGPASPSSNARRMLELVRPQRQPLPAGAGVEGSR